jgi:hypothetical protein
MRNAVVSGISTRGSTETEMKNVGRAKVDLVPRIISGTRNRCTNGGDHVENKGRPRGELARFSMITREE